MHPTRPTWFEAGMGSEQMCVDGFDMGQTSDPSFARKKWMFSKYMMMIN